MPHSAPNTGDLPRSSWMDFDPDWYAQTWLQDAAREQDPEGIRQHYLTIGRRAGFSPNPFFDEGWYRRRHPAVGEAIRAGDLTSGFDHYGRNPAEDRSPHWLFDAAFYLRQLPDEARAAIAAGEFVNAYDHFLRSGDAAGLRPSRFLLPAELRAQLPPEAERLCRAEGAVRYFLNRYRSSLRELRLSPYFDPDWYLRRYPAAAAEVLRGKYASALEHYLINCGAMPLDPLPHFSEGHYLALHPDVARAVEGGIFICGYDHFLQFGIAELRRFSPVIDLRRYLSENPEVRAEIERGESPDVFAHYVSARGGLAAQDPLAETAPASEAAAKALFRQRAAVLAEAAAARPLDFTCEGPALVSVIMVLHNNFELTLAVLSELATQMPGRVELILADSGSTDRTTEIARFVTGARLIRFDENVNFVPACNAALAAASGEAVLYLNNDIRLAPQALARAWQRLTSAPDIGAVGGMVIRSHGLLQEAGCIIWQDGFTDGYMRDASPRAPEANFVRDVDFCSGVFLMVRADLLRALGGFDPIFAPAYFEETDLCVRIWQAEHRVVYDPSVRIEHLEYGSSQAARDAVARIRRNHVIFAGKQAEWLKGQPARGTVSAHAARSPRRGPRRPPRVLLVEDILPLRELGSGFVRSHDILGSMAAQGAQVTVLPLHPGSLSLADRPGAFPPTVEIAEPGSAGDLARFLNGRIDAYDCIWVGRTHNLDQLAPVLSRLTEGRRPRIVLDTEAIASLRALPAAGPKSAPRRKLKAALAQEFRNVGLADTVIAVNPAEARLLKDAGLCSPVVLGHMRATRADGPDVGQRQDLLFVGAMHQPGSPNHDALGWLVERALDPILAELGPQVRLTVIGHTGAGVDLSGAARHPNVDILGRVPDLRAHYDRHRIFLAPTRIAAGIPYKIHEAASEGLPVVANALLCGQLGWTAGQDLLAPPTGDAEAFAAAVVRLYRSAELWRGLRACALRRIETENDPAGYGERIAALLAPDAAADAPRV